MAADRDPSTPRRALLLFSVLMFCYTYVHQGPGWNQNSRLDVLHALFAYRTLAIDAYHDNTGDKAIHNVHYYSDKAPGIIVLALPAFAISACILHVLGVPLDSKTGWIASDWITTAGSVGIISALGGMAMFLLLSRLIEQKYAFLTAYIVFLGAAPFPYSTMLFSHAAVIGLICIALWAIVDDVFLTRVTPSSILQRKCSVCTVGEVTRHLLAGLCCGLAISSEYTAATAAGAVLALTLLASSRRALILILSAIPPLLIIPIYNTVCFGGVLSFGYHNLALTEFQDMNKGLFGITWPPKLSATYLILLSPARGLFFWTPFFLIAFVGIVPLFKASRPLFWISLIAVITHIVCISGYYMPSGGAALGPRHLSPILPFLTLLSALGLCYYPRFGYVLGYFSLAITGLATLITAMPWQGVTNPLRDVYPDRLLEGRIANMLLTPLGLPPFCSMALVAVVILGFYLAACLVSRKTRVTALPTAEQCTY